MCGPHIFLKDGDVSGRKVITGEQVYLEFPTHVKEFITGGGET